MIKGDTVREVLDYVEFDGEDLMHRMRSDVEAAVREGRIDLEQSGRLLRFFEDGLNGVPTSKNPANSYCNRNVTVTVMTTGTGSPFNRVGVNTH